MLRFPIQFLVVSSKFLGVEKVHQLSSIYTRGYQTMMGLGKYISGFKHGVILGINSFDFRAMNLKITPGTWNPENHLTSEPSCSGAKHVNLPGFSILITILWGEVSCGTYKPPNRGMAPVWAFWPRRACCQLWRSWAWPPSATPKRHRPTKHVDHWTVCYNKLVFYFALEKS